MFYKFDSIKGRLAPSNQFTAYNPQGLQLEVHAPPSIIFETAKAQPVSQPEARVPTANANTAEAKGVIPTARGYGYVAGLQKAMGAPELDGLLVWQKRGFRDRLPMWATFGLVAVGCAMSVELLWRMSWPAKQQDE